jgi:hypothetical protein
MKKSIVFLFSIIFFKTQYALTQGCSQCKLIAEQGTEASENTFGSNLNYGILYLMIVPYLILMFLFRKQIYRFIKSLISSKS